MRTVVNAWMRPLGVLCSLAGTAVLMDCSDASNKPNNSDDTRADSSGTGGASCKIKCARDPEQARSTCASGLVASNCNMEVNADGVVHKSCSISNGLTFSCALTSCVIAGEASGTTSCSTAGDSCSVTWGQGAAACPGSTEPSNTGCGDAGAAPSLVEFVVDVSESMGSDGLNTNGNSKWTITQQALISAILTLPNTTAVGLLLWPNMNTPANHDDAGANLPVESCVNTGAMVPIAELGGGTSSQRELISTMLRSAYVAGGTPTADAYKYALTTVRNSSFVGAKYIVLITDGQPTFELGCAGIGSEKHPVDFQPVVTLIGDAANDSIKTFVIGLPGSEALSATGGDGRSQFSAAAQSGGTATPGCSNSGPNFCHYDLSVSLSLSGDLQAALNTVQRTLTKCH